MQTRSHLTGSILFRGSRIKVIEIIGAGEAIGRVRLSKRLSLGEGATQTLVRHLVREGMIEISRSGMVLSKFGEKAFSDLIF